MSSCFPLEGMIPDSYENYLPALCSTIVLKLHLHLKEEKRQILIQRISSQNLRRIYRSFLFGFSNHCVISGWQGFLTFYSWRWKNLLIRGDQPRFALYLKTEGFQVHIICSVNVCLLTGSLLYLNTVPSYFLKVPFVAIQ